jgi:hypothetical protein
VKTLSKICFIVFAASVPFLLYGFGVETARAAATFSLRDGRWTSFAFGAAVFFPTHFVAQRAFNSVWSWLETLEHEVTHLLIGLLFLKLPVGLRVSAHGGGEVKHVGWGKTGQTWIALAPYFFPTVSIFVVVAAWVANLSSNYLLGALGWTTAFHLVSNWGETSFRQPDLKKAGIIKTLIILPVMNLICYGAVLAFVAENGKGFSDFWLNGANGAAKVVATLVVR